MTHRRKDDGRFLVSLPRHPDIGQLGESRSQAVCQLTSLERSLARRGQQSQFNSVIQEYLDLGHAELIPPDVQTAIAIQRELQCLFRKGGFKLHKWNSNDQSVMQHIKATLQDGQNSQEIGERERSTKTLGIEWVTNADEFRLTVTELPTQKELTKRVLVSDIACIFDALGWFSPTIVAMKILLQRL